MSVIADCGLRPKHPRFVSFGRTIRNGFKEGMVRILDFFQKLFSIRNSQFEVRNKLDRFLVAVVALAVLSRIAFFVVWRAQNLVVLFPHDPYPTVALSWLGWTPPLDSIGHPPLYSAFLAVLFWFFRGARDWVVPGLQCLLSAGSTLLLYSWARRVGPEVAAKLAALGMALDPFLIFFAPQYQSETFFVFLILCFFVVLYRALENPRGRTAFSAGFLGGLASLSRGVFLTYAPFLALSLGGMRRWDVLRWMVLGWTLPILLWTLKNAHTHHAFIPVSAQSGWNMYEGFTLDREELRRRPQEMTREIKKAGIQDPIEIDRYFQKKINHWIRENPGAALKIVFFKLFRFWRPWPYDPYSGPARWVIGIYCGGVLSLALWGMVRLRGIWNLLMPVFAFFVGLTILHSIYFTSLRYRIPLEPFLLFFAAVGLVDIWSRMPAKRSVGVG
ncbi:MAG: glycosyltransferase family 39 protein [Elusimicrobia bacterium]|nr:glycosyltransferase family 39 protein [Elusimicrobiota bacterium]